MFRKVVRLVLLALALVIVGYVLAQLLVVTDARRVSRVVERLRQGIVQRDLDKTMSVFASDFEDNYLRSYDRLERWFEHQFRTYDVITCGFTRQRVAVSGRQAACSLSVFWSGHYVSSESRRGEPDLFDDLPVYADDVVLYLEREDRNWLIVGASP